VKTSKPPLRPANSLSRPTARPRPGAISADRHHAYPHLQVPAIVNRCCTRTRTLAPAGTGQWTRTVAIRPCLHAELSRGSPRPSHTNRLRRGIGVVFPARVDPSLASAPPPTTLLRGCWVVDRVLSSHRKTFDATGVLRCRDNFFCSSAGARAHMPFQRRTGAAPLRSRAPRLSLPTRDAAAVTKAIAMVRKPSRVGGATDERSGGADCWRTMMPLAGRWD
jgi:hypothetical protein